MPGKFITLEGIEGSGKSVQLHLLEKELKKRKVRFLITQQPGGTPFGKEVRQILLQREGAQCEPTGELLLYLADRYRARAVLGGRIRGGNEPIDLVR